MNRDRKKMGIEKNNIKNNNNKKSVKFNDQKMKQMRYYCLNDEPNAKEVSEQDYLKIRGQSNRVNNNHLNFNNLKHQESKMEGKSKNILL